MLIQLKAKLRLRVFSESLYSFNRYRIPPLILLPVVYVSQTVKTVSKRTISQTQGAWPPNEIQVC